MQTDLTETLIQIYVKNLRFLEQEFPELYDRVEKLSQNFNNDSVTPKYSLEFLDNYFDILNIDTHGFYYGCNSYEDADRRVEASNFTKDGSIDLLRKGMDGKNMIKGDHIKDVSPIIDYINENVDLDAVRFDKINKFVYLGVGLGLHIQGIHRKLNPLTILIIEPELEIFRLSLFVTDYTELAIDNRKIFFSIEDSPHERKNVLGQFYIYHNYLNYNIKHHLLIQNDKFLYDELVDFFSMNSATSFPYTSTMENIFRTLKFINEKHRFINTEYVKEKKILDDKKVLIVAAGPSLDNYIQWIFQHQDKFLIVAVDIVVKKLEKFAIVPDIVVSIDQSNLCAGFMETNDKEFLKDSAIVLLSQQHKLFMEVVKDKHLYFSQSIPLVERLGYLGSVSNVGTMSYAFAVHFGAKEIYTIGTDAAFNQETGSRYAEDSPNPQNDLNARMELKDNLISIFDVVEVKGNLVDTVKTNRSLLAFKDSFEHTTVSLKEVYEFEVFNLSNGVLIDNFTPMTKQQLEARISHYSAKEKNITQLFDSISEVLSDKDIAFEGDLRKINGIIKRVKSQYKLQIKNRQEFLDYKLEIMIWILKQSKEMKLTMFSRIFLMYIEVADIYINFIINLTQRELFNKQHMTKLNQIWSKGLLAVLDDFKKILQNKIVTNDKLD